MYCKLGASHGLIVVESQTCIPKVAGESQDQKDCQWGSGITSALSTLNTTTEVPLSKAPNPQLLPGRRRIGCPLLRVCVHSVCTGWLNLCRAQIPSMGHVFSFSFPFPFLSFQFQNSNVKEKNKLQNF